MARLRFSRRAEADLLDIGRYTLRTWGERQALRYLDDLEGCYRLLAGNPALGRACEDIARGILVSRILHQRMLPERREVDDERETQ